MKVKESLAEAVRRMQAVREAAKRMAEEAKEREEKEQKERAEQGK